MSRTKKSRSLKRVTGGVKTGSKERTKLENKQRKAKKKASSTSKKPSRQKSVYQKFLDDNNLIEQQHVNKPTPIETEEAPPQEEPETEVSRKSTSDDMWDQLENPDKNNDIF